MFFYLLRNSLNTLTLAVLGIALTSIVNASPIVTGNIAVTGSYRGVDCPSEIHIRQASGTGEIVCRTPIGVTDYYAGRGEMSYRYIYGGRVEIDGGVQGDLDHFDMGLTAQFHVVTQAKIVGPEGLSGTADFHIVGQWEGVNHAVYAFQNCHISPQLGGPDTCLSVPFRFNRPFDVSISGGSTFRQGSSHQDLVEGGPISIANVVDSSGAPVPGALLIMDTPEPSTYVLMFTGLAALMLGRRATRFLLSCRREDRSCH